MARNKRDESFLFENYIKGEIERIESQIDSESALRTHVLSSIAGLFTKDRKELFDFVSKTFFAFQKNVLNLSMILEEKIVSHFGIGPGDLRTMIDLSDWLLYSATEIGKVFGLEDIEGPLSILRVRVHYGIKEELLQLVTLKGIGRIRARNLYNSGFKTLKDIKESDIEELEKVPSIGKGLAMDIKRQVSRGIFNEGP
jgi:replicative superfamily II helicase